MSKVVGIQFNRGSKVYHFGTGHFVLSCGDRVIVKTEQGMGLGEVTSDPVRHEEWAEKHPDAGELKEIFRLATDEDLVRAERLREREGRAHRYCLQRISARELPMKLIGVECLFDASKMIFYFTADGRVDFRELVKDLVHRFRTRIEMRQIGVRNEAKMIGGLGSCGRELCCASFLSDFEPVSVKMAKEQNLSLNPTKISGLCGRLMCCLTYEFETYCWLKRDMPKMGKKVFLKDGLEAKVIRQNVLARKMTVIDQEGGERMITPEDLASPEEAEAKSRRLGRGRRGQSKSGPEDTKR